MKLVEPNKTLTRLETERLFRSLDEWIDNNGWKGWDPYDLLEHKIFMTVQKMTLRPWSKLIKHPFFWFGERFPLISRRLLSIEKKVNPKTIALLALSYIKAFVLSRNNKYLDKYKRCCQWLVDNNHTCNDRYLGWGYPFDWQSLIFIPKETPLCVPTVLAGHAFLDGWELSKREEEKMHASRVVRFLCEQLNKTQLCDSQICFSYSPLDTYLVVNANLYTASFLTRYASLFKDAALLDLARKARRFSILQQEPEGSFPYWSQANKQKMPRLVDNYHTGIVLQWLNLCRRYDELDVGESNAIERGGEYYFEKLFGKTGMPRYTDRHDYPVDIHGSAQALVTFNALHEMVPKQLVESVVKYTLRNMRDEQGYFYYRIYKSGFVSKIPYLRWGQAWMLYGLANLMEYIAKE
jgi:hypothetical protein